MATANCLTCKRAAVEDGGDGKCPRVEHYPELRKLPLHACPLYVRRVQKRPPPAPKPEALF